MLFEQNIKKKNKYDDSGSYCFRNFQCFSIVYSYLMKLFNVGFIQ